MKIVHKSDYVQKRRMAYPAIGDQLDAIYKLAAHMKEKGEPLPPDVERWIQQCKSVKDKYPA